VGSYTVAASATGISTIASFSLENQIQSGLPSSIVFVSGNNQQAVINTTYSEPLKVKILDAYGDPVNGVNVTFTAWTNTPITFASNGTRIETVPTDV
jgi:hypothetical protein